MVLPKFNKLATRLRGFKKATKLQFWVLGTYFQIIIFSFLNNITCIFIHSFYLYVFLKKLKIIVWVHVPNTFDFGILL